MDKTRPAGKGRLERAADYCLHVTISTVSLTKNTKTMVSAGSLVANSGPVSAEAPFISTLPCMED